MMKYDLPVQTILEYGSGSSCMPDGSQNFFTISKRSSDERKTDTEKERETEREREREREREERERERREKGKERTRVIRYRIIRVEKAANCPTNRSRRPADRPTNRAVGRKLKLPMFG